MFETSVVVMREAPRRKLGLFTASIAGHTLIVAAIVGVGLTRIDFPARSPRQMVDFVMTPSLEPPPPMASPRPAAAAPRPPALKPQAAVTAPQVVPPDVPVVPQSTTADVAPAAAQTEALGNGSRGTAAAGSGEAGSPDGVPGGVGDPSTAETSSTQIYRVGSGVSQPIVIHREQPLYPPLALHAHMQGSVTVQCIVNRSGQIRDVQVIRSSFGAFDKAAVDAVRLWRFTPGMLAGKPVDTIFELTVNFTTR